MFTNKLSDIILKGATRSVISPSEKAIERCEKINWFLYKSDYILGLKSWKNIAPSTKKDIVEGLIKYVVMAEIEKVITSYSVTPAYRRMRLAA